MCKAIKYGFILDWHIPIIKYIEQQVPSPLHSSGSSHKLLNQSSDLSKKMLLSLVHLYNYIKFFLWVVGCVCLFVCVCVRNRLQNYSTDWAEIHTQHPCWSGECLGQLFFSKNLLFSPIIDFLRKKTDQKCRFFTLLQKY